MSISSLPSLPLQFTTSVNLNPMSAILADPIQQLSNEFGLQDINDIQTNIFFKSNGLQNELSRKALQNHIRSYAKQLILKLQNMRDLGATAQQIRQTGLDSLRELEVSSSKMIRDFERFQTSSSALEQSFLQFDAKAAAPVNQLSWTGSSSQIDSGVSPLQGAISKYMIQPEIGQTNALSLVLERVNSIGKGMAEKSQEKNRKVDLESKKNQIARCVQMEDPEVPGSAAICIAHHLEGVSESQTQTLLEFVPRAYVGHGVNNMAAPFAAVSKVFKVVTQAIFYGGMNEGCLSENPGDYRAYRVCMKQQTDLFEGRDPKMNEYLKKETPEIVINGLKLLAIGDAKLEELDRYMHDRYRTIPGIVHEGSYGLIDTAMMVPWLRTARGAAGSIANIIKTPIREAQEVLTMRSLLTGFIKDEAGKVKIPEFSKLVRERSFYVKLFENIGYDIVKGGKGSHSKMINKDFTKLPMVIIPKDRELSPNVARNLRRIYEKAIDIYQDIPSSHKTTKQLIRFIKDESGTVRNPFGGRLQITQVQEQQLARPFPQRIDYSHDYFLSDKEFIRAKEFNGVLSRDLYIIQYHSSEPLHQPRTLKWFMPVIQGNHCHTLEEVQNVIAKLSRWGEISEVSVARVPAGEPVRFLHGRAKEQLDAAIGEFRPGKGVQYRFYDFDPNWVLQTRRLPE